MKTVLIVSSIIVVFMGVMMLWGDYIVGAIAFMLFLGGVYVIKKMAG